MGQLPGQNLDSDVAGCIWGTLRAARIVETF